jgi:simple sugar transport system permease protein
VANRVRGVYLSSFSPFFWIREKLGNIHFTRDTLRSLLPAFISVGAVFVSLCIAFVYISISTGTGFLDLWAAFYYAAFGSPSAIGRVLTKGTHILIVTIGLIIAFKSGLFNLGGVGSMAVGAVLGAGAGLFLPLPIPIRIIIGFGSGFLVAGAIAGVLGWFKSRFNIDEIFTTLMTGFVLVAILNYYINGPWGATGSAEAKTPVVPGSFSYIFPGLTPLIFLALALIPIAYYLLNRTSLGFEMRVVGSGKSVAQNQGINTSKIAIISMFLSGGICALAGAGQVYGDMTRIVVGMPGYFGFYAIPAAVMIDYKPQYAFFSSIFLSIIIMGSLGLTSVGVIADFGEMLIGIVFIVTVAVRRLGRKKQ